jgi:hypothetical protein
MPKNLQGSNFMLTFAVQKTKNHLEQQPTE